MTISETEVLDIVPTDLTLSNGVKVTVSRLKTRETLKLLKILTKGAGYALSTIDLSGNAEDFTETLLLAMAFAIPEAEEEAIDFIRFMVTPSELIQGSKLSKAEKEINEDLIAKFDELLDNPELEDLVDIFSEIAKNEGPHLQALGKKIALLLKSQTKAKN